MLYSFPFSTKDWRTEDELTSTAIRGCTFQKSLPSGSTVGRDLEKAKVAALQYDPIYTEDNYKLKCSLLLICLVSQCLNISRHPLLPPLCSLQATLAKGRFSRRLSAVDNFHLNHFMSRRYTSGSQCPMPP